MNRLIIATVGFAFALAACDDGGGGELARAGMAPEDYVPAAVNLADYSPEGRVCVLYLSTATTRLAECGGGTATFDSMERVCSREDGLDFFGQFAPCLDTYATAPCAALEGEAECALVEAWPEPDR